MVTESLPNKKLRIIISLAIMPLAPLGVLFLVGLSVNVSQTLFDAALPSIAEYPWVIIAFCALLPATIFALILDLFFGSKRTRERNSNLQAKSE